MKPLTKKENVKVSNTSIAKHEVIYIDKFQK